MPLPWLFRKTAPPLWFIRVAGTPCRANTSLLVANSLASIASGTQARIVQFAGTAIQQQLKRLDLRVGDDLQVLSRTDSAVMVQTQERLISLSWEIATAIQVRPLMVKREDIQ